MTPEQIDALEAGPETDRLVAEAVGLFQHGFFVELNAPRVNEVWPMHNSEDAIAVQWRELNRKFSPSTDWNSAMWAAERAAIATEDYPRGLRVDLSIWDDCVEAEFHCNKRDTEFPECHAANKSGPLAICKAILRLKH